MSVEDGHLRSWREVARELARETNTQKILELSHELTRAMAAQGMNVEMESFDSRKPNGKTAGEPTDI